jgi:hypothetical protein
MAVEKSKPFDFAQDVTKQVLTLSTGVVTITIAFVNDLAKNAPDLAREVLYVSWGLFGLAIVFGVVTLLNLTGHVGRADAAQPETINSFGIKWPARFQLICFFLAVAGTIYFGARSFNATTTATCTMTTTVTTTVANGTAEQISTAPC